MFGLTPNELKLFKKLNSPQKLQDFLNKLPMNLEPDGDTLKSPRAVMRDNNAHCLEGALFAAAVLWFHGEEPLLLDLKSTNDDYDHVVVPIRVSGRWGALSKTNHAVLRYREPVYRTYGELAMSYFHEYFLHNGKKTMRSYSKPFTLKKYGSSWVTSEGNLWHIGADLDDSPHIRIVTPAIVRGFRKADPIEIEAGKIVEWKK